MNDRRFNSSFGLYSAFSDVDSRFIDEMMDDAAAERIKAANKRKRIRMTGAVAACAAVLVLTVGVAVFPTITGGGLQKSDTAATLDAEQDGSIGTAGMNADGENKKGIYDKADEADETEQAEMSDDAADEVETAPQSIDNMDNAAVDDAEPEEADKSEDADTATEDTAPAAAVKDDAADNTTGTTKTSATSAASGRIMQGDTVTFADGSSYVLLNDITEIAAASPHLGNLVTETDGAKLYGLDNLTPDLLAAAVIDDGHCYTAVRYGYKAADLEKLYKDAGFRYYLHCEGSSDGETDDETFRSSVWDKIFSDPSACKSADPSEVTGGTEYYCRLGTDSELYLDGIVITLDDGYVKFALEGEELAFELN